ncbi:HIT family hydrolase [Eikenella sp. NML99-0057]|uniref:HIT family protein n=1 Tax=Eikenella sp. NML99-0057 TaxID=1795834 RepID=UPI0007E0A616|nr:HIT family protein [Eikenella sp. NML99-0057]OAM45455.1 HIT family hydrolase [Eikenella sp. NML99-0057]
MSAYDSNNIFAKILRGEIPNHTVYEDEKVLAFLDVMPQARGHVLIVPKTQAVELTDLPTEYAQAVFAAAQKIITAQRKVLQRHGIVQMQLNGQEAGQSVFHYHMHLIPGHLYELAQHEDKMADHAELAVLAAQLREAVAKLCSYSAAYRSGGN